MKPGCVQNLLRAVKHWNLADRHRTRPDHRELTEKFLLRLLTSTSHAFNATYPSPERKTDLNPVPGILKGSFSSFERRPLSCLWSVIAFRINFPFVSNSDLCLNSFLYAVKDALSL